MSHLLDTSVLVRLANSADPFHGAAANAVVELHRRGEILHITSQNLVEFRNVATRPVAANGLGLSPSDAKAKSDGFEATFPLLSETPAIHGAWKSVVETLGVIGKRVHDARLVAVCHVHGVSHVLTFNVSHFAGFATFGPGLTVVDPGSV